MRDSPIRIYIALRRIAHRGIGAPYLLPARIGKRIDSQEPTDLRIVLPGLEVHPVQPKVLKVFIALVLAAVFPEVDRHAAQRLYRQTMRVIVIFFQQVALAHFDIQLIKKEIF